MWSFLSQYRDIGLLLLRVLLGGLFLWAHGWDKLTGGPQTAHAQAVPITETWRLLGGAMKHIGINFWPMYWGFMATLAETLGVVLMMIGMAFRPACLVLSFTMAMAGLHMWMSQKTPADSLYQASHAWELGIVFLSLIFIGPGKFSVDKQ